MLAIKSDQCIARAVAFCSFFEEHAVEHIVGKGSYRTNCLASLSAVRKMCAAGEPFFKSSTCDIPSGRRHRLDIVGSDSFSQEESAVQTTILQEMSAAQCSETPIALHQNGRNGRN